MGCGRKERRAKLDRGTEGKLGGCGRGEKRRGREGREGDCVGGVDGRG